MNQDARAFPNSKYLLLLLKTVGLSVQAPTLLGSTLSVALESDPASCWYRVGLRTCTTETGTPEWGQQRTGAQPQASGSGWCGLSSAPSLPCHV